MPGTGPLSQSNPGDASAPRRIVQAAIIGMGRMGLTHLSILGGHPFLKVRAAADEGSIITRGISKFRPDIKLYEDYRTLLQNEELDAVLIATPPHLHGAMIDAAMDRNLSVFVEKPFTLDSAEAQRLAKRSSDQPNAYHQVGYVARFGDVYSKVKALLDGGLLGKVFGFRLEFHGCTVLKKENGSGWRGDRKTGGGCLNEFGSHAVDMVVNLFGKPSSVKGSSLVPIFSEGVEDMVLSTLTYADGKAGSLYVNWSDSSHRKPSLKTNILGEKGHIQADFYGIKIFMNEGNQHYKQGWNTVNLPELMKPVPFYVRGAEFTNQLYSFAEGVLRPSQPNPSSFADAATTQEVIDMIFADADVEI